MRARSVRRGPSARGPLGSLELVPGKLVERVRDFTLLLSPDVFDFAAPIAVTVNGREVFNGPVKRDLAALLKWAARDNDRTMLYGAELKIHVP